MSKTVPASGSPKSKIWFIGDAPTQSEVVQGEPFVGNAGNTLRRFCMQIGLDPTECYLDNIYQKRPPRDKLLTLFKTGVPSKDVQESIDRLNNLIRQYRPNLIVPLGPIPTAILTGLLPWDPKYGTYTGLQNYRGSILSHNDIPTQKVIPTYHPSYINREGYSDHGVFIADLVRVLRESNFPEIRKPEKELICGPMGPKLYEVRDRLLDEGDVITADIEYIGSRLLCIGLTNSSDWAVSIRTQSETEMKIVREILTCGKGLNMQNAMFDCSILEWHYGIPAFKYLEYDTMLAAHAINIELPKGLDFLCSIYTDQPYYKSMVDWDKIKNGEQSIEILFEYNAIDAWTQHEIMEKQISEDFSEDPEAWETFQFEMALVRPLWEMSSRGMKVDVEKREAFREQLEKELTLDRLFLQALNGGAEVNVKSGDIVSDLLFNYLKLRPAGKTKKGKYKTDDKTMASLLGRATTPQQIEAIKRIRSARSKRDMISKFLDVEIDDDGRTRGMYNPGGTVTGRLASKKFYPTGKGHQQQNIPRAGRTIIIPDTGYTFGSVDKERAESLIVAHLTNDPLMLKHHEPGADGHTLLAMLFFDCDADGITKDRRFLMKKTRHAGNYMEGHITFMRDVNTVAHQTGVSITSKEAKEFIEWYHDIHVGLRPWWAGIRDELYKKRSLINMLGRRRTFFDRPDSILPKAVAYNPQGTIGDIVNLSLLTLSGVITEKSKKFIENWEAIPELKRELDSLGFQLLNQVHDSIGFQFPSQNETRVVEIVDRALDIPLQNPHTLETFRIGNEFKFGKSWGEAD